MQKGRDVSANQAAPPIGYTAGHETAQIQFGDYAAGRYGCRNRVRVNRSMAADCRRFFWQPLDPFLCSSGKLCGRIVVLGSLRVSWLRDWQEAVIGMDRLALGIAQIIALGATYILMASR